MTFKLIKKANKLVLWDFVSLAKNRDLQRALQENRDCEMHMTAEIWQTFWRYMVFKDHWFNTPSFAVTRIILQCKINFLQETVNTGFFHMRSTCRRCGGQGHIITTPCKKCRGKGNVHETKTISIPIPAGISTVHVYNVQLFNHYTDGLTN